MLVAPSEISSKSSKWLCCSSFLGAAIGRPFESLLRQWLESSRETFQHSLHSLEVLLALAERQLQSHIVAAPLGLLLFGFFPRHCHGQLQL